MRKEIIQLIAILFIVTCRCSDETYVSQSLNFASRFHPNEDLMSMLINMTTKHNLEASNIQTCVGSVLYCGIRTANQSFLTNFNSGPYEIVSLVGTISKNSQPHIHISLADKFGNTIGGHLPSLEERRSYNQTLFDCPIYTTAEVVLTQNINLVFERPLDPQTGYDELSISYKKKPFLAISQL